jgi:hypothetical protein
MAWFAGLRVVVYLKRIAQALERIADFTDAQMPMVPKRSRRGAIPEAEVLRPTVKEWNEDWRKNNPDDYERIRDEV